MQISLHFPIELFFGFIFSFLIENIHAQQLPGLTGPYTVSRRTFVWIDSSRNDLWALPAIEKRKLMVVLWYPADSISSEKAEYFPLSNKIKGEYSSSQRKMVQSISAHALLNASLSKRRSSYPVLIFSPGADMPVYFYTSLLEELASHGYIIAAIEHTHEGVGQVFPDGSVIRASEKFQPTPGPDFLKEAENYYKLKVKIRSDDASFVLSKIFQLNESDHDFESKINVQQVGIFGHSVGGVTAAQTLVNDKRFKAAINYDGLSSSLIFFSDSLGRSIEQPFMFIMKPFRPFDENQLKRSHMAPEQDKFRIKYALSKIDSTLRSVKNISYRFTIFNAQHESFSDIPFFDNNDVEEKDKTFQYLKKYTLSFFNRFLLGEKEDILNKPFENENIRLEIYNSPFSQ